jgi:hypothetical protein
MIYGKEKRTEKDLFLYKNQCMQKAALIFVAKI